MSRICTLSCRSAAHERPRNHWYGALGTRHERRRWRGAGAAPHRPTRGKAAKSAMQLLGASAPLPPPRGALAAPFARSRTRTRAPCDHARPCCKSRAPARGSAFASRAHSARQTWGFAGAARLGRSSELLGPPFGLILHPRESERHFARPASLSSRNKIFEVRIELIRRESLALFVVFTRRAAAPLRGALLWRAADCACGPLVSLTRRPSP